MRIVKQPANTLPPSSITVWLDDGHNTWCGISSKSVEINGRTYQLPGGTLSFDKGDSSREELLRMLLKERDVWKPGNDAELIAYAEGLNKR